MVEQIVKTDAFGIIWLLSLACTIGGYFGWFFAIYHKTGEERWIKKFLFISAVVFGVMSIMAIITLLV